MLVYANELIIQMTAYVNELMLVLQLYSAVLAIISIAPSPFLLGHY
jgi:hypothetical protein